MKRRIGRWNGPALVAALLGALGAVGISCQTAREDVRRIVATQDGEDAGPARMVQGDPDRKSVV